MSETAVEDMTDDQLEYLVEQYAYEVEVHRRRLEHESGLDAVATTVQLQLATLRQVRAKMELEGREKLRLQIMVEELAGRLQRYEDLDEEVLERAGLSQNEGT